MVTQLEMPVEQIAESVRPYRFTIEDFHRLAEADIFAADTRVELIEGELMMMSPIGKRHAAYVNRYVGVFRNIDPAIAILSVQNPLLLPNTNSEPVPDVMLLKPREDFYEAVQPQPADVLLLIEVSDTTLNYDRRIKLPLYARHGIIETWITNLVQNIIEIYTEPKNGIYTVQRIAQRGEQISPQAVPDFIVNVDAILG
ncbi:MAG: Uma2 family endonuclease [Pyrinomonadaceae bacterium MAG19_C2-C3]|nr:Uma2 family endonuclease [Pyrinomonadaceae bacterium MAG19_C2-C3]